MQGIYKITCLITGDFYIGKSVNIKQRWTKHRSELKYGRSGCTHLQNAWTLYGGLKNFKFEVVEEVKNADLLFVIEKAWIAFTQAPYNIMQGGEGVNCVPESVKEKLREANTGKVLTEEHKQKISEGGKGIKRPPRKQEHTDKQAAKLAKPFFFVDKDGKFVSGTNLNKFCRENSLDDATMHRVSTGKTFSHKGYTNCMKNHLLLKYSNFGRVDVNHVKVTKLMNLETGIRDICVSYSQFAKKYNLTVSSLFNLINKKTMNDSYKGWRVV